MKNIIRTGDKIWSRRSKNLVKGEIQCPRCGAWKKVGKFTDKHFNEEYLCSTCKKETKVEPKKKVKEAKVSRSKPKFPENCPHKPFFGCTRPNDCIGCYYNPDMKMALSKRDPDDERKVKSKDWFYGDKKHAKECLEILEDIRTGKGLHKNGTRHYFKYARKSEDDE